MSASLGSGWAGGARVAGKPQPAAIRAETLDRELIVTRSARSVGRGAIIRRRGTARAMMGKRGGSRPQGLGYAFIRVASAGNAHRGNAHRGTARRTSRQRDPDRNDVGTIGAQPRGAAGQRLARRPRHVGAEYRARG